MPGSSGEWVVKREIAKAVTARRASRVRTIRRVFGREGAPAPRPAAATDLRQILLDGFLRLVRLLDAPEDIPVLAPLVLRELHYRLLQGEQHGRLAAMAIGDGRLRRVAGGIAWIRAHYSEPLRVDALAKLVGYASPSQFSREYARLFGQPPRRDAESIRADAAGAATTVDATR